MLLLGASGSVTFSSVPPRCINNYCPYTLRVVGVSTNGVRRVIRRHVRPGELQLIMPSVCDTRGENSLASEKKLMYFCSLFAYIS